MTGKCIQGVGNLDLILDNNTIVLCKYKDLAMYLWILNRCLIIGN